MPQRLHQKLHASKKGCNQEVNRFASLFAGRIWTWWDGAEDEAQTNREVAGTSEQDAESPDAANRGSGEAQGTAMHDNARGSSEAEVKEKDLLKLIQDWLTAHKIFHWRSNTGAVAFKGGAKTRFVRFGTPGTPDIIACVSGRLIGIEVKGEKGEQSQVQHQFQVNLCRAGGLYLLAKKFEDVSIPLWEMIRRTR